MMKDQKGITLVALIITIIVMLILVAVTISVALQGGLFQKARDAATGTKQAQLKEAATLAKAEVMADYFDTGATVNASTFAGKVKEYLDGVTPSAVASQGTNGWIYTVSATGYDDVTISVGPGMATN